MTVLTTNQKQNEAKAMYEVYTNQIKVFQLNDYEWVAAKTLDEAIQWYKTNVVDDNESIYDVHEIEDLNTFMVVVDGLYTSNDKAYIELKEKYHTNKESHIYKVPAIELLQIEWKGNPYMFASTEW